MKLISCHINNFGTLTNYEYRFKEGINTFCDSNGKGKTTLANFIKAMLYGLPTKKDNQKEFSDREHYFPFNGGTFGGSLTLEKDNKIYIIERVFDIKSSKKDILNIYDEKRNKIEFDINNSLGEYFFEIDEESFKRTIFIYANDIAVSNTDSISKKLNNLIDNTAEKVPFDKLLKNIDDYCKKIYRPNNKGKKGSVEVANDKIYELNDQIHKLEAIKKGLVEQYNQKQVLENKLEDLKNIKKTISEQKQKQAYIEKYNESSNEIKIMQQEVEELDKKYPYGFINKEDLISLKVLSEEEKLLSFTLEKDNNELSKINLVCNDKDFEQDILSIRERVIELVNYEKALNQIQISDIDEYHRLKELFNNEVPNDEDIKTIRDKLTNKKQYEYQLTSLNNIDDSRYKELSVVFKDIDMSSINLQDTENKIDNYNSLLKRRDDYYLQLDNHKKNDSFILWLSGLIVGVLLVIAGVIGTIFNYQIGIPFIVVGLVVIVIITLLKLKKIQSPKINKMDFNSLKLKIDQIKTELSEFFNKFDIIGEDYKYCLEVLKSNYEEYQKLADKVKEKAKNIVKLEQDIQALNSDINQFILRYKIIEDNIDNGISILQRDISKYAYLEKECLKYEETTSKITIIKKQINDFFAKYNLHKEENLTDQINKIIENLTQFKQYDKIIKENEFKLRDNTKKITNLLSKYHITITLPFNKQYEIIDSEINYYFDLINQIKNKQAQLENYKKEKDLDCIQDTKFTQSEEDIDTQIEECNKELFSLSNEINKNEEEVSHIVDKKNEIAQLEELIKEKNKKYQLLKMVQQYFINAEQSLKDKYIGPLEQTFKNYLIKINNSISDNSIMDFDFDVKYDINGYTRSNKHLSDGQKACLMLSIRLAMIQNMYKKESPFIIIDDALMALDETNFNNAIKVIKDVAKNTQIIYFCCHSSRTID